jgi:Mycobacterium 19 kDa lipoprotein antigen
VRVGAKLSRNAVEDSAIAGSGRGVCITPTAGAGGCGGRITHDRNASQIPRSGRPRRYGRRRGQSGVPVRQLPVLQAPSQASTARSPAPTGSPNAGAPQFKIVVGGQTIDPAAGCAEAGCRQSVKVFCKSSMNGTFATFAVRVGPYAPPYAASAILTTGNPPTAVRVNLVQFGGKYWAMQQSDTVSVTRSGNAYTITGTITPTDDPINAQGVRPIGLRCLSSSMRPAHSRRVDHDRPIRSSPNPPANGGRDD